MEILNFKKKIVKIGGSYLVSLPKAWVDKNCSDTCKSLSMILDDKGVLKLEVENDRD